MRLLVSICAVAGLAFGQPQAPPASKAAVPFQCVPEELDAAGLTCTAKQPCTIYLELSALEPVGGRLVVAGNIHTPEATLTSILLSSDDGGHTWMEPFARLRGAGLEQIQFLDYETGWVVGQVLQGRPRDPFFLLTRDGGKSWQIRPVFDESHTGVVEKFAFESRTRGSLLVDRLQSAENGARHELYESNTGGDSWSVLQVSDKPLQLKHKLPEANPDWRLRPDAPSKSYKIEQRQADRWHVVSTLPIHLGECSSMDPPPLPEPTAAETGDLQLETSKPAAPARKPSLKKKP